MTHKQKTPTKKELQEKVKELENALKIKTKLAEERFTQLKYMQADFENYKKRFERERENIIRLANERLIKQLLPIIDDFERALESMKNEKDKKGLSLIYKNFLNLLEKNGLKKIEALGKKFDPYYHEAILKEKSEKEENTILEEIQKGYTLNSKVIRHAKVKVAGRGD